MKPEKQIQECIMIHRNELWTEIINKLHLIVKRLRNTYHVDTSFRIADWASFCLRITDENEKSEIEDILSLLSQKQSYFTLEDDSIYESLLIWLEQEDENGNNINQSKQIKANHLFNQLADIAKSQGLSDFPKNSKSFGKRLNQRMSDFSRIFDITATLDRTKTKIYSISKIKVD